MNLISKFQPYIILFFASIGLLLGLYTPLKNIPIDLVEIFLILLLYVIFLSIDVKEVKNAFTNIKYTSTALIINFIITPIIAYILGFIFFENNFAIRIGLFMLLITPCTDWYLVFTKLTKGNVEINIALLPINLVLQIVLLPIFLYIFFANTIDLNISSLINSILFVLCLPFILAMLTRKYVKESNLLLKICYDYSDLLQLFFLCMAVCLMFICEGEVLIANYPILLKLFIPLLFFYIFTYLIASFIAKILHFNKANTIALHFTTLARNSPLVLALAVSSFANEPLIALSLIIAPLIELPVLSIISTQLNTKYNK